MAESYRSLEARAEELETELNLLQVKTETLENAFQEEKKSHQHTLARCEELQEQLQRLASKVLLSLIDIRHQSCQN
jgi:chromosome segregation ATPase